jgi:hypothetical protein
MRSTAAPNQRPSDNLLIVWSFGLKTGYTRLSPRRRTFQFASKGKCPLTFSLSILVTYTLPLSRPPTEEQHFTMSMILLEHLLMKLQHFDQSKCSRSTETCFQREKSSNLEPKPKHRVQKSHGQHCHNSQCAKK